MKTKLIIAWFIWNDNFYITRIVISLLKWLTFSRYHTYPNGQPCIVFNRGNLLTPMKHTYLMWHYFCPWNFGMNQLGQTGMPHVMCQKCLDKW